MIRELVRIRANGSDPYHNLAVEEYLTMHAAPGQCVLFLWQNHKTVVIGKNQNAWKECNAERLTADGGHLVRRLSGGGAVYHDLGNLNFTFCVNKDDYDIGRQTEVILEAVQSLGIDAVRTGRNDLTVDGRKFSGHAFLRKGMHCYHHGTVMLDVDGAALAKYLRPDEKKLAGKGVDSVRARVANLREFLPDLTVDALANALTRSFSDVYGLPVTDLYEEDLPADEIAKGEAFFRSWDWIYGRPIPFDHTMEERYAWGDIQIHLHVDGGVIKDAVLHSDGLEEAAIEAIQQSLKECRYECGAMQEAIRRAVHTAPSLDPDTVAQMGEDLCAIIEENME